MEDLNCNNHHTENVVHVECHIGNCEEDAVEVNNTKENQKSMTAKQDIDYSSVTEIQTHLKVHL